MLPARIPKKPKRASRWRSQAHEKHVKGFACSNCGSMENIEGAHVRNGGCAGMGQRDDDWRMVSLCLKCHRLQHTKGEKTFWNKIAKRDPELLIEAFIRSSPKRHEIEQVRKERENA